MNERPDYWIAPEAAPTLAALFEQRVARTPDALAYRFYAPKAHRWVELTWRQASERVAAWRAALTAIGIGPGDRVAIMLRNSPEWLCVDQAVLSLGAVTVGLFCADTPASNAGLLDDSGAKMLVAVKGRWAERILDVSRCQSLTDILVFAGAPAADARIRDAETVLGNAVAEAVEGRGQAAVAVEPGALASLVYTSGTTGRARAAMMTHRSLVWNAQANAEALPVVANDHSISYLPLPHSYERVADAYRAMITGGVITFCRHQRFLQMTLARTPATSLVGVPRVYERFYLELHRRLARQPRLVRRVVAFTIRLGNSVFERQQGRSRRHVRHLLWPVLRWTVARRCLRLFGGQMEYVVCGAAALPSAVARTLTGLGLPVLQGYGLTEAGPVVSVNRLDDNDLNSVGRVLEGVETRVGPGSELFVRSPGVMQGYWRDDEATAGAIDAAGWLHTGDKVSRLDKQRIYLTGRVKEVIVMATGGKASPEPLEQTLLLDRLVERVIVVGEARPSLAAVISCPASGLAPVMRRLELDPDAPDSLSSARLENFFLQRFAVLLAHYPAHAQIRRVAITTDSWTRAKGLVTATDKTRRRAVARRYARDIARLFGQRAGGEKTDASHNTNLG